MQKKLPVWVFVFELLLCSCNNTVGNVEIKGKVVDDSTRVPIPGISITIQGLDQSNAITQDVFACQLFTDSAGCFAHTLKKVKNASLYTFTIDGNPDYKPTVKYLGLSDLHSYGKFLTLEVTRLADLSIKINRVPKSALRDTLIVRWETNGWDGPDFYPYKMVNYLINSQSGLMWIGGTVKSEIRTKVFADKKTIVHWELFRQGVHKDIIDTIFCRRNAANSIRLVY